MKCWVTSAAAFLGAVGLLTVCAGEKNTRRALTPDLGGRNGEMPPAEEKPQVLGGDAKTEPTDGDADTQPVAGDSSSQPAGSDQEIGTKPGQCGNVTDREILNDRKHMDISTLLVSTCGMECAEYQSACQKCLDLCGSPECTRDGTGLAPMMCPTCQWGDGVTVCRAPAKSLSHGCADCWAKRIWCQFIDEGCRDPCLINRDEAQCLTCQETKCLPAFKACSGLKNAGVRYDDF